MDKKRGIKNVVVSITFKILLLVASIFVRRFLIRYIGNEINGLNSLYLSIIGILSVAELGIGSAITFCMYKPIVNNDNKKVSALYELFTKTYHIVGMVIFVFGLLVLPFIKYLAYDYQNINVNMYITFLTMLVSVVLSYMYSSKIALIDAYKDNYISTTIHSICMLIQYLLQIIVTILFRSFEIYLICRIISVFIQWALVNRIAVKKHNGIIKIKAPIDSTTKSEVIKSVSGMFAHKIGATLINTSDSVIISAFIGVEILGGYSNYTSIMTSMVAVLVLLFTPLTAVVGHVCVSNNIAQKKRYFKLFYSLNFVIGVIFFMGYYAIIDDLISVLFGAELVMDKSISFIITLNYFIQFMRQTMYLFRDATGTFKYAKWKPIAEGVINIILSILLVKVMGVVGVIIATIITNILLSHVVDPYILYRKEFKEKAKEYYIKNYTCILSFIIILPFTSKIYINSGNNIYNIVINGVISVVISIIFILIYVALDKETKEYIIKRMPYRRTR